MKNNVFTGLFAGLAGPFIMYLIIQGIFFLLESLGISNGPMSYKDSIRPRTVYLFSICGNILLVNYFQRKDKKEIIRGVALMTVAYAMAWLIYYGKELL
jgi:hypothetical protein